ncbi:MAG: hypothetical protein WCC53_08305 [Thermoanaerobaculia bacterium]
MTSRRSVDLEPPPPRPVEPSSPRLRRFPIVLSAEAVAAMSRRQDALAAEKAVERHERREKINRFAQMEGTRRG